MTEELKVKVRCFESGAHPEAGTWRENEVVWLPVGLARAMIDCSPPAAEAVDEAVPTTKPVPKKAGPRRAVAPEAEKAVEAEGPGAAAPKGKKETAQRKPTPPVPPPAPGTRR